MMPKGNVLRVESASRLNAGYVVCEGETEHGLMFAARAQLKVIGINHSFTNVYHFQ